MERQQAIFIPSDFKSSREFDQKLCEKTTHLLKRHPADVSSRILNRKNMQLAALGTLLLILNGPQQTFNLLECIIVYFELLSNSGGLNEQHFSMLRCAHLVCASGRLPCGSASTVVELSVNRCNTNMAGLITQIKVHFVHGDARLLLKRRSFGPPNALVGRSQSSFGLFSWTGGVTQYEKSTCVIIPSYSWYTNTDTHKYCAYIS